MQKEDQLLRVAAARVPVEQHVQKGDERQKNEQGLGQHREEIFLQAHGVVAPDLRAGVADARGPVGGEPDRCLRNRGEERSSSPPYRRKG